MEQKIPGILIAAVRSGSGKTTVTCALLEALKERGMHPCAFKCGPDYIDPMFHKKVISVPSHNLDSFFSDKEQLCEIYAENTGGAGITVVEGAMGLFDGLGGIREEGSAYHIAVMLKLPILLVIDAHGMGRSVLPVLKGFCTYDKEKLIAGVILNRISEYFYKSISHVIESELRLPVLGFLPENREFSIERRHLGLKLPGEIVNLKHQIHLAAQALETNGAVDRVIEIANQAGALKQNKQMGLRQYQLQKREGRVNIGVALDEAFCFYYEENLALLEQNGARLVFFSPLHDRRLPEGLDAILLGGGYPEVYAMQLEQNSSMRNSIRQALKGGMPSVAECGGFMYLHDSIEDDKKNIYHMCGVLPGRCFYTGKLVRFGYIELEEMGNKFLEYKKSIKGHEFHYYDSEDNGGDCLATKPITEKSWYCIHSSENHFWGFPHLYYPSNPDFAVCFVERAISYQKRKGIND